MNPIVLATFVLVMGVVLSVHWFFIVRPEGQEKTSLIKRVRGLRTKTASVNVARGPEPLSNIPLLDALLSRRSHVANPLKQLLVEAGLQYTVGVFVLATFVSAAAVGVATWLAFHVLIAAIVLGVAAAFLPLIYVRSKRKKRLEVFEEQFPEAIDLIARALRAGHALTTGLGMVADEIPAPVGDEFKRLYDEQNFGMSLPEAMRAMAQRVPVLDARFFVTAVLTQREAGGNLSEVLDNLASVMRQRFKVKRQIRVASAHGRLSAWILSLMPPVLAAFLFTTTPSFMRVLWEDPWGLQLLMAAGLLQVIGSVIIARMVRIGTDMELAILLPIVVLFMAVAVAVGSAAWVLTDPQLLQQRLATVAVRPDLVRPNQSLVGDKLPAAVKRVRSFVPKSPKAMNRIERRLVSAGYHGPWPATLFVIAELVIPAAVFGLIVFTFGTGVAMIFAVIAAMTAFYIPNMWLGRAVNARRREIQNGLPDAIDLLIVCIEAGSGIDQALNRVAEELALPYPALTRELEMISSETRAGKPRMEAFKNFADRTKVDDVRSLVAMLVQTDRFGTSLGSALRIHAETSRTKRRQRAEERAAKLGIKLLFPLVFCMFPAFYLIVLGPSMLKIFRMIIFDQGL